MFRYQLYLLATEIICTRLEFFADEDMEALQNAALLFHACSDVCSGYELWSGSRMLTQDPDVGSPMTVDAFGQARQRHIVDLEETLHNSRWRTAKSLRLPEMTDAARKVKP